MIEKGTLEFLKALSENNNREWFNSNKEWYNRAKNNFTEFVDALIVEVQKFDPFISDVDAKSAQFRIFKDVRFSKNKDPYKTNFGAVISKGGRKSEWPGYYLHIQPGNENFVAGGVYQPSPQILQAVRQEIDYNTEQFLSILQNPSFKKEFPKLEGDKLKRPPKGYNDDHPAIEYLKKKDFLMMQNFNDEEILKPNFIEFCVEKYKVMQSMDVFLRGPVNDVLNNG